MHLAIAVVRRTPDSETLKPEQQHGGEDGEGGKEKNKSSDAAPTGKPSAATILAPEEDGTPPLVIEEAPGGYMYGHVLSLTSTTADALETLEYLESIFHPGYAVIVPHNKMQTNMRTVKGNMRLTSRTGMEQMEEKKTPSSKSLATIFELESDRAVKFDSPAGRAAHTVGDSVVARAVIAYRDACGWPSLGPTIQSIEVRRDYQGSGLVQDLFNAIEG